MTTDKGVKIEIADKIGDFGYELRIADAQGNRVSIDLTPIEANYLAREIIDRIRT